MVSGENALLLQAVRCSSCWRSRMEPCPLKVCKGHWWFGGWRISPSFHAGQSWEQAPGPAHCCEDEWDDFSIAVGWAWFWGTESTWKSCVIHPHRASVLLCRGNSPSLRGAVSSSKSLKCIFQMWGILLLSVRNNHDEKAQYDWDETLLLMLIFSCHNREMPKPNNYKQRQYCFLQDLVQCNTKMLWE